MNASEHHMHWIGRPECVEADCEPDGPSRLSEPVEVTKARLIAASRRPFIARRPAR